MSGREKGGLTSARDPPPPRPWLGLLTLRGGSWHPLRWAALGPCAMELVMAAGHLQALSFHPHPSEPVPSRGPTSQVTDSLGYGTPCQVPEQHQSPSLCPETPGVEGLRTLARLLTRPPSSSRQGLAWSSHCLWPATCLLPSECWPPMCLSSSCHRKLGQAGRLRQRTRVSHSCGGWKAEAKTPADLVSVEDPLPGS